MENFNRIPCTFVLFVKILMEPEAEQGVASQHHPLPQYVWTDVVWVSDVAVGKNLTRTQKGI